MFVEELSSYYRNQRKSIYEEGELKAQKFNLLQKPIKSTRIPNLALLPLFHKYNVIASTFVHYEKLLSRRKDYRKNYSTKNGTLPFVIIILLFTDFDNSIKASILRNLMILSVNPSESIF